MQPSITAQTRTTTKYHYKLGRVELQKLFQEAGISVPQNAEIYISVPGGGDWSNTSLDITEETPIEVSWSTVTEG